MTTGQMVKISIVVLTYNRKERVVQHLQLFAGLHYQLLELVVVDNASDPPLDDFVTQDDRVKLVRNQLNMGAVGRNSGIAAASGDIIITLDDDVYGITDAHLQVICSLLQQPELAAVVFRVEEESTGRLINWCHPYDASKFSRQQFETNDISEGAVAFRRSALQQVGLYPDYFFISHEGPDLALRLINAGWKIIYSPQIAVTHGYDTQSRTSWRRYYYDTRNTLWLVLRNYPFRFGASKLLVGWGSMFVYALRDGYLRYWFKAVFDALKGASKALHGRTVPQKAAWRYWSALQKNRPGFWTMVYMRVFKREVRI